jgi:hypothetical protein
LCSAYTEYFDGWYDSSNNDNSNGCKLFCVRYEPNHKMHINFSLWRVQRDTRLETYATGQYALRFMLGWICFVLSGRSLVICKVYVPLLRDVEFLELPILNLPCKIQSEPRPHHKTAVMCQQWQQQVYTGPKLSHDLHPTLNRMQSLIPKNLTKTAKNATSHLYNDKFNASQTVVCAIPRCSLQ